MILVQVNKLWSLEEYDDRYWFSMQRQLVINMKTGQPVHISIDKRGYPVVFLKRIVPTKSGRTHNQVKFHKIVALAMIHNGPYTLIEHLDDNPLNWHYNNLKFSDQRANYYSMVRNGHYNRVHSEYQVVMADDTVYTGEMKDIATESGIPKGTLYDRAYKGIPDRWPRKHQIRTITELSTGDGRYKDMPGVEIDSNGNKVLYHDKRFDRSND